jgi:hypothetical protein
MSLILDVRVHVLTPERVPVFQRPETLDIEFVTESRRKACVLSLAQTAYFAP